MHTKAVYGLSGDPIHNGHRWVLEYAAKTYERVYLVMATNPAKRYAFPPLERMSMCRHLAGEFPNVEFLVITDDSFLARKTAELGATAMLRGVRNSQDAHYEEGIRLFNKWLVPSVETVCVQIPNIAQIEYDGMGYTLTPVERTLPFLSSSLVKGIVGLKDWRDVVCKLVPDYVMPYLESYSRRPKE